VLAQLQSDWLSNEDERQHHTQAHLSLADKGLISTEETSVFTRDGLKRNGTLRYTIQLFQEVLDAHYQNQLDELEVATARWEHAKTASL